MMEEDFLSLNDPGIIILPNATTLCEQVSVDQGSNEEILQDACELHDDYKNISFSKGHSIFDQHFIKTDVKAVKCIKPFLLAGIGNMMLVFDNRTLRLKGKYRIFDHNRIHLFSFNCGQLAIAGSFEITACSFKVASDYFKFEIINTWNTNDWIMDVIWIRSTQILIMSANNSCSLWDSIKKIMLKKVVCDVKCLLFSGSILGDEWHNIILLSGTLFRSILIWAPCLTDNDQQPNIMHKLRGHNGGIMSVMFNERNNCLCSASEDRSIRLWRVSFPDDEKTVSGWGNASIKILSVIYGHMGRVWKALHMDCARTVSVGEDGQLRIWNEDGSPSLDFETHQGASVWTFDIGEKLSDLVTGGKDGGVYAWGRMMLQTPFIPEREPPSSNIFPKKLLLLNDNLLMAAYSDGSVCIHDFSNPLPVRNTLLESNVNFSNCIMRKTPNREFVILTSETGCIAVFQPYSKSIFLAKFPLQIQNAIWLSNEKIIIYTTDGLMRVYHFHASRMNVEDELKRDQVLQLLKTAALPSSKRSHLTCACLFENRLICGNRNGNLYMLDMDECGDPATKQHFYKTIFRAHGILGVTDIVAYKQGVIQSIGKDGYLRVWTILQNGDLASLSSDKLPVKWAAKLIEFPPGNLSILGFHELHAQFWNLKENICMFSYECGGGHRDVDFMFSIKGEGCLSFVCHKTIYMIPLRCSPKISFLEGFHTRVINCLLHLSDNMIISGSEDTTLRISKLANEDAKPLLILRHKSSVKSMQAFECHGCHIVTSVGGRGQLMVWKVFDHGVKHEEVARHMFGRKDNLSLDPRYTDVAIYAPSSAFHIAVAGSDGILRLFALREKNLALIAQNSYHKACILRLITLTWCDLFVLVTTCVDGKVAFWDITGLQMGEGPFFSVKIHQSGINGCDAKATWEGDLILVTGGDDGDIIWTLISKQEDQMYVKGTKCRNFHSAKVSGVKLYKNYTISASADHRVVLWRLNFREKEIFVENLSVYRSVIPDIQGLALHIEKEKELKICVYGAGIEIMNVNLPEMEIS